MTEGTEYLWEFFFINVAITFLVGLEWQKEYFIKDVECFFEFCKLIFSKGRDHL